MRTDTRLEFGASKSRTTTGVFHYRAGNERGDVVSGTVDAETLEDAHDLLWSRGLTPLQVSSTSQNTVPWWKRELFERKTTQRELATFTRDLATLLDAKVPLNDALRIIADPSNSSGMTRVADRLRSQVIDGASLAQAMEQSDNEFSVDYISALRAAEMNGALATAMAEVARLLERRVELESRIRSALVYPAMLLLLAAVSIVVLVYVLVPALEPLFTGTGRPLPLALSALKTIQESALLLVGSVALGLIAVVSAHAIASRNAPFMIRVDQAKTRLPLVGPMLVDRDVSQFSRTLGSLLQSDVTVMDAAMAARNVVINRFLGQGIDDALGLVRQGYSLSRALDAKSALLRSSLHMIVVGEETGRLPSMLLRVASIHEARLERSIERGMTLFTPLLTIVIAALIGSLLISVMSAILSVNDLALQ